MRKALVDKFDDSVKPDKKAIKIAVKGNRRSADVVVSFEFRRYYRFKGGGAGNDDHVTGMCFFLPDGTRVKNFPEQHKANLTARHQETNRNFKPMIRVFKNMRTKMIDDGIIPPDSAPSYYIEGLLFNVPKEEFTGDYQDVTLNILKWLYEHPDRTEFECAISSTIS